MYLRRKGIEMESHSESQLSLKRSIEKNSRDIVFTQAALEKHIQEFSSFKEDSDDRWTRLMSAQEKNTLAISELTRSTKSLLSAWDAANGTITVMSSVGKVVKWASGFAVIGAMAQFFLDK